MRPSVLFFSEVTPKNISWIIGTANKILKFHILIIKKRIPSSSSSTFLNRHKLQFQSGALQTTSSNVYYFVPFTTDRSEEINRYLGSVNLSAIDIPETAFETNEKVSFDPSKLDFSCQKKEIMTAAVVKMVEKILDMSIANLKKNANGLLSKRKCQY